MGQAGTHEVSHALGKLALREDAVRHEALAQHGLLVGRDVLLRAAARRSLQPRLHELSSLPLLRRGRSDTRLSRRRSGRWRGGGGAARASSYCSTSAVSTLLLGSHEFADESLPAHLTRNSVRPERRRLPSTRSTRGPVPPEAEPAGLLAGLLAGLPADALPSATEGESVASFVGPKVAL